MPNQIKTGISGLDSLLCGGIPEKNQVMLTGGPGSGKTLLSFEFLYRNAKAGNTSLMLALEEDPRMIVENAKSAFKSITDIDDMIKSKKLIIDGEDPSMILHASTSSSSEYEFGKILADIESTITSSGATRLVIDSISVLDLLISDKVEYRKSMLTLVSNIRRLGVTSLMTAEMLTPDRSKLKFKTEFFLFDGIIIMYEQGEDERRVPEMEVIKMRGAPHSFATTPYEITPGGFDIVSDESLSV